MSSKRVSVFFDDETKIDFLNEADALHHLSVQGQAGVVDMRLWQEDGKGERLYTRAQLAKEVTAARNEGRVFVKTGGVTVTGGTNG